MAKDCKLYLISPGTIDPDSFLPRLEEALSADRVASFQLRMKEADRDTILKTAEVLKPVLEAHDVAFIINDDPQIAVQAGADGVHLGPDDMGVKDAREILGHDGVIGYSAKASREEAFRAGEQGADYVAFGSFFPSATKPGPYRPAPEILAWWAEIAELPSVAIGGITPENCGPLVAAGADFLAVSSAVWQHEGGPAQAVKAFGAAIDKALE